MNKLLEATALAEEVEEAVSNGGANLSAGVAILLSVLALIVAGVLIFFLYRGIIKDRNRLITAKLTSGEMNAEGFDDMVRRRVAAAGKNTRFTVMLFEINDAKNLKDAFGEKQYNTAISIFIERISKSIPKDSKMCIYGTDNVTVFINTDLDGKVLGEICDFCMLEGSKPMNLITKVKTRLEFNLGVATYDSQYANDYEQFKQNVELALVTSKRMGLNQYVIYSPDLMSGETEEYKYYQEIKSAIEANEFTLYCQPVCRMEDKSVIGYETLMRWNHKTLGVLSPASFLNIMEQTGDIYWVGNWALEQVAIVLNRLIKDHPESNLVFSMNLSPKQLMNPKLCDELLRIMRKHHAPADRICMEIVEFAMFDKMETVTENISKLRQIGFKIAIDDFSLDTSSLKILENVKCDYLKLDKHFVESSQDDFLAGGVVTTIVGYAEKNNFKVIAEGIEDDTVFDYVKNLKIPLGQGYYFGKPKPFAEYGL